MAFIFVVIGIVVLCGIVATAFVRIILREERRQHRFVIEERNRNLAKILKYMTDYELNEHTKRFSYLMPTEHPPEIDFEMIMKNQPINSELTP